MNPNWDTWKFNQNLESKRYVDGNGLFEEIGDMFKIRKHVNNIIREKMNIKESILDHMRHKELNWYGHVQRMDEKRLP